MNYKQSQFKPNFSMYLPEETRDALNKYKAENQKKSLASCIIEIVNSKLL